MKPMNKIVISLTLLALLIGCYKANKIPATETAQVISEQQQEIATQQEESVKEHIYGKSPMRIYGENHTKCCCRKFSAEFIKGTDCENILWQALNAYNDYWRDDNTDEHWKEFQEEISTPYGHILYCAIINTRFLCINPFPCPNTKGGCSTSSNTNPSDELDDLD